MQDDVDKAYESSLCMVMTLYRIEPRCFVYDNFIRSASVIVNLGSEK